MNLVEKSRVHLLKEENEWKVRAKADSVQGDGMSFLHHLILPPPPTVPESPPYTLVLRKF